MSNKEDSDYEYENEEEPENDDYYDDDYVEDEEDDEDEDYDEQEEEEKQNEYIAGGAEEDSIDNENKNNYMEDEEDDEDGEDENYLQKFDRDINKNILLDFHPECKYNNYNEIELLSSVSRDNSGIIIDDLHKTIPILTKYEYSKVLGVRASQINSGSTPYIDIPLNITDGYLIAKMELQAKVIPFIIKRPVGNAFEIWKLSDLELLEC